MNLTNVNTIIQVKNIEGGRVAGQVVLEKDVQIPSGGIGCEVLAIDPDHRFKVSQKTAPGFQDALHEAEWDLEPILAQGAEEQNRKVVELEQLGFHRRQEGGEQNGQAQQTQRRPRTASRRQSQQEGQAQRQTLSEEERRRRASEASKRSRERRKQAQAGQQTQQGGRRRREPVAA